MLKAPFYTSILLLLLLEVIFLLQSFMLFSIQSFLFIFNQIPKTQSTCNKNSNNKVKIPLEISTPLVFHSTCLCRGNNHYFQFGVRAPDLFCNAYTYFCTAIFMGLLVCFTEVLMKPLKNQKFVTKEIAYESISSMKGLSPFCFHTPLPNPNCRGTRASMMNWGGERVRRQPNPFPKVPEPRARPENERWGDSG